MLSTYVSYQLITRDMPKAIDRVEREPTVDRETKYYLENISKVKTIEEFVKDDRLFRYAMKAHGLEDMAYAKAFMVKALKEGVRDPDSFANKLQDKRYAEFVKTYNFERYGEKATIYNRALHDAPTNFASTVVIGTMDGGFGFVEDEVGYYVSNISSVASIDELMADSRLLYVAMGAFGLDANTETPERIREMLEGGVADPQSPANSLADKRYAHFVAAFDFAAHGAETTSREVVQDAPKYFVINTGLALVKPDAAFVKAETDYYKANIGKVRSIDDLMRDQRLLRIAMSAYGLNADTEEPRQIRAMLAGGVSDPGSPANQLADKSYAKFVAAFNFVDHGAATTTRDAVQKDTLKLYTVKTESGLLASSKYYIDVETNHYLANVGNIKSIDDLMANKRLLDYALAAYGLDPTLEPPARVRQMLEGGVADPKSPANQLTDKAYVAFVTAFNFAEYGEAATTRTPAQLPSIDKFLRQTLEENAGKENEGVRLALYFERKAASLTNFYEILADPALAEVVRTALSLPDSFAAADIDRQVKLFEERLDIEDFTDPARLEKFLTRFTSMWEISNPSAPAQAQISVLFSQPVEFGVSTDLLFAIQSMKR
ncbi:DUF1217 domain-containing protein [Mesorhizobium sp. ZMM04-5]|uniref:DUF1217 domain-containing protein n=1 Tax=Mesorhizobium marinum TaxID=3228790 RepID=A0ABV3QUH9_9HYPH